MKRTPIVNLGDVVTWVRVSRTSDKHGPLYAVYWSKPRGTKRVLLRFRSFDKAKDAANSKLTELRDMASGNLRATLQPQDYKDIELARLYLDGIGYTILTAAQTIATLTSRCPRGMTIEHVFTNGLKACQYTHTESEAS